jgi:hypothetical protein
MHPFFLQLDLPLVQKSYPFKFNGQWLNDKGFADLVYKVWNDPLFLTESGKQRRINWKLQVLKKQTKQWLKNTMKKKKKVVVLRIRNKEYS